MSNATSFIFFFAFTFNPDRHYFMQDWKIHPLFHETGWIKNKIATGKKASGFFPVAKLKILD